MSRKSPTNRYRSGAKGPHRQVLVCPLEDGRYSVAVVDEANWRVIQQVIGTPPAHADKEPVDTEG